MYAHFYGPKNEGIHLTNQGDFVPIVPDTWVWEE